MSLPVIQACKVSSSESITAGITDCNSSVARTGIAPPAGLCAGKTTVFCPLAISSPYGFEPCVTNQFNRTVSMSSCSNSLT